MADHDRHMQSMDEIISALNDDNAHHVVIPHIGKYYKAIISDEVNEMMKKENIAEGHTLSQFLRTTAIVKGHNHGIEDKTTHAGFAWRFIYHKLPGYIQKILDAISRCETEEIDYEVHGPVDVYGPGEKFFKEMQNLELCSLYQDLSMVKKSRFWNGYLLYHKVNIIIDNMKKGILFREETTNGTMRYKLTMSTMSEFKYRQDMRDKIIFPPLLDLIIKMADKYQNGYLLDLKKTENDLPNFFVEYVNQAREESVVRDYDGTNTVHEILMNCIDNDARLDVKKWICCIKKEGRFMQLDNEWKLYKDILKIYNRVQVRPKEIEFGPVKIMAIDCPDESTVSRIKEIFILPHLVSMAVIACVDGIDTSLFPDGFMRSLNMLDVTRTKRAVLSDTKIDADVCLPIKHIPDKTIKIFPGIHLKIVGPRSNMTMDQIKALNTFVTK